MRKIFIILTVTLSFGIQNRAMAAVVCADQICSDTQPCPAGCGGCVKGKCSNGSSGANDCGCTGSTECDGAGKPKYITKTDSHGNTYKCEATGYACGPSDMCKTGGNIGIGGGMTLSMSFNRLLNSLSPIQSAYAVDGLAPKCQWNVTSFDINKCTCTDTSLKFKANLERTGGSCEECFDNADCPITDTSLIKGAECISNKCMYYCKDDGYYSDGTTCKHCSDGLAINGTKYTVSSGTTALKEEFHSTKYSKGSGFINDILGYGFNGKKDCYVQAKFSDIGGGSGVDNCTYSD